MLACAEVVELLVSHAGMGELSLLAPTLAQLAHSGRTHVRIVVLAVKYWCTWTLHCDLRLREPELFIECRYPFLSSPEYPSNSQIIAHHRLHQGAAYALAPVFLGHHEH